LDHRLQKLHVPRRFARKLAFAGFIRGSLDEGVVDHALSLAYGQRVAASAVPTFIGIEKTAA
jgi:hypothetical protein